MEVPLLVDDFLRRPADLYPDKTAIVDGDLRFTGFGWSFHDFRGERWTNVTNTDNRRYLLNAYRVLLTRARQGMVIFVPPGDPSDPTRSSEFYDSTFKYLSEVGVPEL